MTQEEKQLLLTDLSARLRYGVKAEARGWDEEKEEEVLVPVTVYSVNTDGYVYFADNDYDITYCSIDACRLYLRPMSSMTEEEEKEIQKINWQFCRRKNGECYVGDADDGYCSVSQMADILEYLNQHHFDYRGLIPMGLALEAPEGMYEKF